MQLNYDYTAADFEHVTTPVITSIGYSDLRQAVITVFVVKFKEYEDKLRYENLTRRRINS